MIIRIGKFSRRCSRFFRRFYFFVLPRLFLGSPKVVKAFYRCIEVMAPFIRKLQVDLDESKPKRSKADASGIVRKPKPPNEKKLACHLCPKKFDANYLLQEHLNSHSGNVPFQCPECKKGFTRRSALWNHKRVHVDTRPFKCSLCEESFKWKNSLQAHLLSHERDGDGSVVTIGGSGSASSSYAKAVRSGEFDIKAEIGDTVVVDGKSKVASKSRRSCKGNKRRKKNEEDGADEANSFLTPKEEPVSTPDMAEDLTCGALNLCPRDLLQFDSPNDQVRYEEFFVEAASYGDNDDHVPTGISPVPLDSFVDQDENVEVIDHGCQVVAAVEVVPFKEEPIDVASEMWSPILPIADDFISYVGDENLSSSPLVAMQPVTASVNWSNESGMYADAFQAIEMPLDLSKKEIPSTMW